MAYGIKHRKGGQTRRTKKLVKAIHKGGKKLERAVKRGDVTKYTVVKSVGKTPGTKAKSYTVAEDTPTKRGLTVTGASAPGITIKGPVTQYKISSRGKSQMSGRGRATRVPWASGHGSGRARDRRSTTRGMKTDRPH